MIRFRAFGSADLRDDNGNELRALLSRPGQLGLLAYLVAARPRGFHRRDTLIGMFWAETGQEQARNALRQAVHRLRHEVGTGVIESRGAEELSVNSKVLWSDVAAFDDALAAGKIADALSHYRGNLLPGFFLSDAPGFEQWLETERGRLRERAASAAWDLSRAESASGQLSMASHWARWAYALNPDDEADLRKLIDVLVRAGDHSSAVRAYEEFAERVSREYEIEPSSATRKLVEPLRAAPGGSTRPQTVVRQTATPFAPYTPYTAAPPPNDVESVEPAAAVLASGKRNWRRLAITGTAAVSILTVLALVGWRYVHNAAEPPAEAIAVFPFSIRGSEELSYLREGMVDLLSAKLDGAAGLRSIDPRTVISSAHTSDSSLSAQPSVVADISRRLGAGAFVIGDVVELAGRVNVSGVLYDVHRSSRPVAKISVEGDVANLPQLVDQLAGQLLAARARARDPAIAQLAALTTHSLPALTAFLEGESDFRVGHAEAARDAFRTAIRDDSTFALAYIRLATTQGWSSASRIDPLELLATARLYSSRLSPLARQLLEGYDAYYHSDGASAVEIFSNLTRTYPDRVEAWFMLGEAQSHLALFTGHSPADARTAFERTLALDHDNPHALVHLARLAASEQRYGDLTALVGRYLATQPDGDRVLEMRALRAFSLRDSVETAALLSESKRAGTLDLYALYLAATSYTENMEAANSILVPLMDRAPRIEHEFAAVLSLVPLPGLMQGRLVRGGPGVAMDALNAGWPAVLRSMLVIDAPGAFPAANLRALRDTVTAWRPGASEAASFFPNEMKMLPQIRAYLSGLLSVRLRDMAAVDSSVATLRAIAQPANDSGVSQNLLHLVLAEEARSRGHLDEAMHELEQFQFAARHYVTFSFRPAYAQARFLRAEILHGLGRDDEAVHWYSSLSEQYDAMYLPLVHLRMGEIAARRGDKVEAARQYGRFASLWKNCDPELQPVVGRARREVQ